MNLPSLAPVIHAPLEIAKNCIKTGNIRYDDDEDDDVIEANQRDDDDGDDMMMMTKTTVPS